MRNYSKRFSGEIIKQNTKALKHLSFVEESCLEFCAMVFSPYNKGNEEDFGY